MMKKVTEIRFIEEENEIADIWMNHMFTRLFVEQLDLPLHLKQEVLYELLHKNLRKGE
ncbi:hypothetical protein [Bacillus sp. 165]|uniref:hypothetical protein n=1 Tax=Bacillus sp. 165 TaxID=1529117 RepID=UPI001ADBFD53|nr:hypothetical protein [Bacillus sp. 165]MBO9128507.1 hypothetical protein [Bacillus sp. 165]